MRAAKIMHLCAQNYQPAVTQSSQQLISSNVNSLKDCSNFKTSFLSFRNTFCPNNIYVSYNSHNKQSLFPQNSIDRLCA